MKIANLSRIYLDKITPYRKERWAAFFILLILYYIRILTTQRFYLITYCLSIYLLHCLIGFLTPKEETIPDLFDNFEDDVYVPRSIDDEFRPFIRRLPEFTFWLSSIQLVLFSLLATVTNLFDIPVYAPILVFYFIFIVCLTIKNLYQHMKKYNYNPFFSNKDVFKSNK